jgi:NTP pyrophosphatase (non-canonical NTP hydrolase)
MNRQQLLLAKLAEECNEVAQIALKTQQFGLDEKRPGQPYTNAERVHQELNDLLAIVEMLNDEIAFGFEPNRIEIHSKKKKVNRFADYSAELGQVAP